MKRYLDQRLRLQLLRVVDALEVHGSLLKASAALGLTQPALTRSLKDIEDLVGTRLFERHARGVRPTESGLVLVRSSRKILAELKRAEEDLDHLTNPFGGIAAIGALPVAASSLAPMILTRLRRTKPDLKVRVEEGRTEELLPLLAAGQIDLILGRFYEPPTPDSFVREKLWDDPIALVARSGHQILIADSLDKEGLAAFEMVLPVAPQRVAAEAEALIEPLGLDQASAMRSSSYAFTREILLSTDAFAIMPPMVVLGDIKRGWLGARSVFPAVSRPAGIITAADRKLNDAALAFIDCLHEHIDEVVVRKLANIAKGGSANPSVAAPLK